MMTIPGAERLLLLLQCSRHWRGLRTVLLALLLPGFASAADIEPWMRAEWVSTAPHFRDLGLDARQLAGQLGNRVLVFAHPLRDVTLPAASGPRTFRQVRFSSSVTRVEMPAEQLKKVMFDLNRVKEFNRLITASEVVATDGSNVIARYRIDVPLPVLSLKVDFRVKHVREADSMSAVLIDGQADSLLAVLGGVTESLKDQPGIARTEVIAVDATHSLVVTTAWMNPEPRNWLGRLILKQFPEVRVVMPYAVVSTISEAIRRRFNPVGQQPQTTVPGYEDVASLHPYFASLSHNGFVGLMHTQPPPPVITNAQPSIRYVSVATRVGLPPPVAREHSTLFARWPEVFPEIRRIKVKERNGDIDLDLKIRIGISLLTIPFDVQTRNVWDRQRRLDFYRLGGDFKRIEGSGEWLPLGDDTLLFISAGFVLGEDANWLVRMAHDIARDVPFIDELATMSVAMGMVTRFQPWLEAQGKAAMRE